ncbi:MAG: hypothetical protein ABI356_13025 [Steroidobacteraceae bacterium]
MKVTALSAIAACMAVFYSAAALAGVFADDLGKCLVNSTTKDDRANLIRWLFVAASHHPAVKPIATVTPAQQEESDKQMGTLVMKLLTESCKTESQKALQTEGTGTIQFAFEVLGRVAGQELFSSPEVAGNLKGLAKYIDPEKIKALSSTPAKSQ